MALDGIFLNKLTAELCSVVNCHIDKIHQPTKDEIIILLRGAGFSKRLLISAKPGSQRIHFTNNKFENPETPPMFCMLLRKYAGSGRITKITQPEFERLIEIEFSSLSELGDIIYPKLIIELISSSPNIILVDQNEKIIDALHRVGFESKNRVLLPGVKYEYPKTQEKIAPLTKNTKLIANTINSLGNTNLENALLNTVAGLSPLICREITASLKGNLEEFLSDFFDNIRENSAPYLIKNNNGEAYDFSFIKINQYQGFVCEEKQGFSELLDEFYTTKMLSDQINKNSADLTRTLNTLSARITKRIAHRKNDLLKCENREDLRVYGELLKANLYNIKPGSSYALVPNFYSENLEEIKIPLNPALSPQANAAKYFKDYKKTYAAEQSLKGLIESDEKELEYIESLIFALSNAENLKDIAELREELITSGYIKNAQNPKKKKQIKPEFKEFTSPSGFKTLVGKNNLQNDLLTCTLASKNDMWFHVKNAPGSHVIVFCGGQTLTDKDVLFAANLAAQNSKMCNSSNVPVDYTQVKYVKKPSGAKPGMVIYTTNNTVFVTPAGI